MDERMLQLKQLKKEYKKAKAKAGWGWKMFAWIFGVLTVILAAITVFVFFNQSAPIAFVDNTVWEPLKAMIPLGVDYAAGWRLTEAYGLVALTVSLCITGLFDVLGYAASEKVKKTELYLNYRTLKLTLDTEKEERRK